MPKPKHKISMTRNMDLCQTNLSIHKAWEARNSIYPASSRHLEKSWLGTDAVQPLFLA